MRTIMNTTMIAAEATITNTTMTAVAATTTTTVMTAVAEIIMSILEAKNRKSRC